MTTSKIPFAHLVKLADVATTYPESTAPKDLPLGLTLMYTAVSFEGGYPDTYAVIIVFKASDTRVVQISISMVANVNPKIRRSGNATTWTPWKEFQLNDIS